MAQQVNITELSLPQLEVLKNQLDQEVEFLSSSIAQLKVVQTKYVEAKDCLTVLTKGNEVPYMKQDRDIPYYAILEICMKDAVEEFVKSYWFHSPALLLCCLNKLKYAVLLLEKYKMYVPGKLSDVSQVLIDVGTGYYVEKSLDDARDFFKRKIDFLTKEMEKIQPALQEKHAMKQAVIEMMSQKIQQLTAAGASQATAAKA